MKRVYLLFLIISVLVSCNQEDYIENYNNDSLLLNREEAYNITYSYLSYSNGQFKLMLSSEEAKKLGVSDNIYQEMLAYLDKANRDVNKVIKENPEISFFDPQSVSYDLNNTSPLIKTRSEGWNYQGSGSMPNQNQVWATITVPPGYSSVRVVVYSNALIGLGSVNMETPYGTQSMGTYNILFWNGAAQFSLPVNSGMQIKIGVSVASDQGGSYSVSFGR